MRSSRILCLLLSVFLCCSSVLFPAAAAGNYWTIDDLEADPLKELEDIKGAGPAADQLEGMSIYEFDDVAPADQPMMFFMNSGVELVAEEGETVTSLSGADFVNALSFPYDLGFLVQVYQPPITIPGGSIPGVTSDLLVPEDLITSTKYHDSYNFYQKVRYTVTPEDVFNAEYQGAFNIETESFNGLVYELDVSSLGSFSSFQFNADLEIWFKLNDVRVNSTSLELYVNGSLIQTFYPCSDNHYDIIFEYDFLNEIDSVVFKPCYNNEMILTESTDLELWLYFYCFSVEFLPDISEQSFRRDVLSGIGGIFQGILELPGKIVNLLIDGLKSLFIPSEDDMTSLTGKYQTLLSERLGFIWQAYELVSNLFTGILDALESGGAYEFSFPGISFPFNGEELVLLPETPVSLENEVMDVIRPVLGTIVCFIAVVGFINVAEGMVMALISGVSYYEFLHGKRGGSG